MVKIEKISALALMLALTASAAHAQSADDMILQNGKLSLNDETAKPAAPATSALRTAGLWLVLFGAAAGGATLYLRRRTKASAAAGSTSKLSLVEKLPLGNNRELLLVKACDRLLIVASQANQITLLSDLAADDVADIPAPKPAFNSILTGSTQSLAPRHMRATVPPPPPPPDVSSVRDTISISSRNWPEMEGAR